MAIHSSTIVNDQLMSQNETDLVKIHFLSISMINEELEVFQY